MKYDFWAHRFMPFLSDDDQQLVKSAMSIDVGDYQSLMDYSMIGSGELFEIPANDVLIQIDFSGGHYVYGLGRDVLDYVQWRFFSFSLISKAFGEFPVRINVSKSTGLESILKTDRYGRMGSAPSALNPLLDQAQTSYGMSHEDVIADQCILYVRALHRAIEVMSCSNVATRTIIPSIKASKKNEKIYGSPLISYGVIVIKDTDSSGKAATVSGTGSSPRLHFRRGHIRKLATGRRVWVQSCMVGDAEKGMSINQYQFSPDKKSA